MQKGVAQRCNGDYSCRVRFEGARNDDEARRRPRGQQRGSPAKEARKVGESLKARARNRSLGCRATVRTDQESERASEQRRLAWQERSAWSSYRRRPLVRRSRTISRKVASTSTKQSSRCEQAKVETRRLTSDHVPSDAPSRMDSYKVLDHARSSCPSGPSC